MSRANATWGTVIIAYAKRSRIQSYVKTLLCFDLFLSLFPLPHSTRLSFVYIVFEKPFQHHIIILEELLICKSYSQGSFERVKNFHCSGRNFRVTSMCISNEGILIHKRLLQSTCPAFKIYLLNFPGVKHLQSEQNFNLEFSMGAEDSVVASKHFHNDNNKK